MRFLLLAAAVPEKRAFRRQRENLRNWNLVFAPLENQNPIRSQHAKALGKSLLQFFAPVAFERSVFQPDERTGEVPSALSIPYRSYVGSWQAYEMLRMAQPVFKSFALELAQLIQR